MNENIAQGSSKWNDFSEFPGCRQNQVFKIAFYNVKMSFFHTRFAMEWH